jgi:hypothetical protein
MALPVFVELSEEGGPFSLFKTRRRKEGGRRSLPAGSRRKDRRLCGRIAEDEVPSPSGAGSTLLRRFLARSGWMHAELDQLSLRLPRRR